MNKHLKLITCESGDWHILLVNEKVFASTHSIGNDVWIKLLNHLGYAVEKECISDEEMESMC